MVNDNEEHSSQNAFRKMYKLPKPRDRDAYVDGATSRYSMKNSNIRIDLRPGVFVKLMKVELILFFFGLAFAICNIAFNKALPFYSKYLNAKIREPDDFNIENIKKRKSLSTFETHVAKQEFRKRNNSLTKEEQIRQEIEKTLKDLDESNH
jgi:hypothetical protein